MQGGEGAEDLRAPKERPQNRTKEARRRTLLAEQSRLHALQAEHTTKI